jgi:hypothetical protein
MTKTRHASHRMQQRGIPPLVVDWLLTFGHMRHDHRGAIVYYFDKHPRRNLERAVGRRVVAHLAQYLDAYAVSTTNGDNVITVGYRRRRFNQG